MNPYLLRIYIKKLSLSDIYNIALKNDIVLSKEEALNIYNYIKNNYNAYIDGNIKDDDVIHEASLILSKDNYNKLYNIYLKYKCNK